VFNTRSLFGSACWQLESAVRACWKSLAGAWNVLEWSKKAAGPFSAPNDAASHEMWLSQSAL